MNKAKISYPLLFCLIGLALIVTLLSLGVGFLIKPDSASFPDFEEEINFFPEPKWSSYRNLSQDAILLWQSFNWKVRKPGGENPLPLINKENTKFLSAQQEKAAFQLELVERQTLCEEAVKLRQKQIELEFEGRLKQKQNQAQYMIKAAVEKKKKEQAVELADFQRKVEEDYSLKLVRLHFKTKIPDLSPEERSLLTKEISVLEQELKTKISEKTNELEEELQIFENHRNLAATKELEDYHQRLKEEGEINFLQEKQKLEQEFFEWKRKRESESGFSQEIED